MSRISVVTLLVLCIVVLGSVQIGHQVSTETICKEDCSMGIVQRINAGYNSPNITVVLLSPANQSTLVGTVNISIHITSVNGPLNATLFINNAVYPAYNRTLIGVGAQNLTIDTTTLPEGRLNFTLLLEDYRFTPIDRETYYMVFTVNNHGPPSLVLIYPRIGDKFIGMANLTLNITSDYDHVYMNVTIDNVITPEFNSTLVPTGLGNYTINGSRYENGYHTIKVKIWTPEGLSATVERSVEFLDYVRIFITEITHYSEIYGNFEFKVRVASPYSNITICAYVDGVIAPDVNNITISTGKSSFLLNTTPYTEGLHNFTFIGYDAYGHKSVQRLTLNINNHGVPSVRFVEPTSDVVVGVAAFTINITTTWRQVNITVYVDNVAVESMVNVTVNAGLYTFFIDTSMYSKWQHSVKVVVITEEGLSAETTRNFGFGSVRIEEVLSVIFLFGLAMAIPISRKRTGQSIKATLIADALFAVVVFVLFVALGINTLALAVWHFNLASIWAIGLTFLGMNLLVPILVPPTEE